MNMINVYWTISEETKVSVDAAKAILQKHGISTSMMDEVTDRKAVRRGIDKLHNRRVRTSNRRISEKIRENSDIAVFGILHNENHKGIDVTAYKQDTKVVLNKNAGTVEATGEMAGEVLSAIDAQRGTYNDADIRRLCYNLVRSIGGVSKRPSGGIYILPACYADRIDALRLAVNEMVGNCATVYTERIFDGEEEKKNMATSVSDDIGVRVARIMEAVSKIGKQTCRLNTHKASVGELKELVGMYKNILGEQDALAELSKCLGDAENTIADQIQKVSVKA